jgi:hypothetical protein
MKNNRKLVLSAVFMFSVSCGVDPKNSELLSDGSSYENIYIPVAFHFGKSRFYRSEDSLRGVVSELQRLYDQAGIKIVPSFANDANENSGLIDVIIGPTGGGGGCGYGTVGGTPRRQFARVNENCKTNASSRGPTDTIKIHPHFEGKEKNINVSLAEASLGWVIGHEVGHNLGLNHMNGTLLNPGATNPILSGYQINRMRASALKHWQVDSDHDGIFNNEDICQGSKPDPGTKTFINEYQVDQTGVRKGCNEGQLSDGVGRYQLESYVGRVIEGDTSNLTALFAKSSRLPSVLFLSKAYDNQQKTLIQEVADRNKGLFQVVFIEQERALAYYQKTFEIDLQQAHVAVIYQGSFQKQVVMPKQADDILALVASLPGLQQVTPSQELQDSGSLGAI